MSVTGLDIDNVKSDIKKKLGELSSLFSKLGRVAFNENSEINFEPAEEPYNRLKNAIKSTGKQNFLTKIKLKKLYLNYGQVLGKAIDQWMVIETPEEIQRVCRKIQNCTNIIDDLEAKLEFLKIQKEIDVTTSKIQVFKTRIEFLEKQQNQVNKTLSELENQLEELRDRQSSPNKFN